MKIRYKYNDFVLVKDLADTLNLTIQAIHWSIKNHKLKAEKIGRKWIVHLSDVKEYLEKKYDRNFSLHDGNPLFDRENGEISVKDAANKIGVTANHLYYAIATHKIPSFKRGIHLVLKERDVKEYLVKSFNWSVNTKDVYVKVV